MALDLKKSSGGGGADTNLTEDEVVAFAFNPANAQWKVLWNEFMVNYTAAIQSGDMIGTKFVGSVSQATTNKANRPGVVKFNTTTAAGGVTGWETDGGATITAGDYAVRVGVAFKLDQTPTAAEDVAWTMGLGNNITTYASQYLHIGAKFSESSSKWVVRVKDATTTTTTVTTVNFDTNWNAFEVFTNADWTSIKFYINGVLVHTQTTNIPSVNMQFDCASRVGVATGAHSWYHDWAYFAFKPSSARDTIATWLGTF